MVFEKTFHFPKQVGNHIIGFQISQNDSSLPVLPSTTLENKGISKDLETHTLHESSQQQEQEQQHYLNQEIKSIVFQTYLALKLAP